MVSDKYERLRELLGSYGSCLVAYSGGVDSAFLAQVAHETPLAGPEVHEEPAGPVADEVDVAGVLEQPEVIGDLLRGGFWGEPAVAVRAGFRRSPAL